MPADRFYLDDPLLRDSLVMITGKEHQHLAKVMRLKEGKEVELVNGRGTIAIGKIDEVKRHETMALITESIFHPKPSASIILGQAMPKLNRLEFIFEKGTELGVSEFWLFPTKLSEKKPYSPNQQERLHQILISAMKQCGVYYLPKVRYFKKIDELEFIESSFFGDVDPEAPKLHTCLKKISSDPFLFITGPESGFTKEESKFLISKGVKGVSLHPNILRTETAAITAAAIISHLIT